jgi:hypothetical protein
MTVSVVTVATDCLCRYVRVHLHSYHAFNSLDHWNADHRDLCNLYHRNLTSFSPHYPVLTPS